MCPPALLPARVGTSRAARAVLGGEALPSSWWAAAGLIDRVLPAEALDAAVDEWFTTQLAPRSAAALAHAAEATRAGTVRVVPELLADLERQYLDRLMQTHDASEGIAAFMERRLPQWRDR
jgi:enoyl-CoA hydratase/carnithine racemase